MKALFVTLIFLSATLLSAQSLDIKIAKAEDVYKRVEFREITPDTLEVTLLLADRIVYGKMIKYRLKCVYDFEQKYEGDVFYCGTKYLDDTGKVLNADKVLGVKENLSTTYVLPGNNLYLPKYTYPRN